MEKWPFPKGQFNIELGQLGSTILARLRTPFQEVPNDQIRIRGHTTSYWRPTIANSHTRVSCIRPMHQFHRAPATRNVEGFNFKTNASIPPRRQPPPRWRLDQTHSWLTMLYVLAWEWPTRCPGIACYLDEEHHMNVCIVWFPHNKPRHGVLLWRETLVHII